MKTHYIGADVDSKMTELAVEMGPEAYRRHRVPTTIPAIREVLAGVAGRKCLAIEEGPMADWLRRNLKGDVDELIVCDPRRNRLIAQDGPKDDPLDAGRLAALGRGGYLKPVYHSDDADRVALKRWVGLYHDRVKTAVAEIAKLRARCRMDGVRVPRGVLHRETVRTEWLQTLEDRTLARQLEVRWVGYDAVRTQVRQARAEIRRLAKRWPILARWEAIPGIGPIRAVTFFVHVDTPFRFARKSKLWTYAGIGLMRRSSGTGADGRPKPGRLRLAFAVNRHLKNAVLGAALSAIRQGGNGSAAHYERMVQEGAKPSNARHTVARQIAAVMWGMWKSDRPYDPRLAGGRDEGPSRRTTGDRKKGGGRRTPET